MFKKAGEKMKRFLLTSGEDVYNDDYYDDEEEEQQQYYSHSSGYDYEEDPMQDHYSRGGAARRTPDKQPTKSRTSYKGKIVELGYTSSAHGSHNQTDKAQKLYPEAVITHPKTIGEASRITGEFCGGKMVIVDLSGIDSANAQRIADYLGGVVHAEQGDTIRINNGIFAMAPPGYDVSVATTEEVPPTREFASFRTASR